MKFNIKAAGKSALDNGKPVLVATAGVIGAQKFLDFKTMFPQVDPTKWFMKHEGAVKAGAVLVTLAMWQKCPPMLKWLLWGVAIQGSLKEVRTLTMNPEGKAFFESIGAGEYDNLIDQMANNIKNEAGTVKGLGDSITNNSYSSVSGPGDAIPQNNASTGVAGMGWNDDDN